ncbi:MAG: glycosyltransferase [Lentisphaeria bacterium]|nr:glycosyltransferase [Lentisphaeria bacterium]
MNVLVNANCSKGGSIPWCAAMTVLLGEYPRHRFVVCVSPQVRQALGQGFVPASNVEVLDYPRRSKLSMLLRRAPALDALVDSRGIDMVLTVFGPAYWRPRVPHLCGFAKSQYIYRHSPFFRQMSRRERLVLALKRMVHMASFRRDPDAYITEREPISEALRQLIPGKPVYTVSNSCNPVFARQEEWMSLPLPPFDGVTLLTVSADYPHKNLGMIPRVAEYLRRSHPEFKFRFVVTLGPEVFGYGAGNVPEWLLPVGKVDIRECPSLYEQCDIMFLPTLLECFSASYAEAMKMKRPILTSDLSFARGLCGVAAEYFDPLSPESAGEAVYRLANAPRRRRELVEAGEKRGREFLSAEARTLRYIHLLEKEYVRHWKNDRTV